MATRQLFRLDQGGFLAAHETALLAAGRATFLDVHDVAERILGKFRELPALVNSQFAEVGRIELGVARNVPPVDAFVIILHGERPEAIVDVLDEAGTEERERVTPQSACRLEFGFDAYRQYRRYQPELPLYVIGRSFQWERLNDELKPLDLPRGTVRFLQKRGTHLRAHLELFAEHVGRTKLQYPLVVVSDLQYLRVSHLMRGPLGRTFRANECFPRFLYAPWLYGGHATPEAMLLEAAKIARDIQAGHAVE